jgi:hypothetical protein
MELNKMWVSNKISQLRNNFWVLWFLILIIVFLIHCLTLTVSPTIWQDEVQIIDYGRTFLSPNTDYSMSWDVANNRPYLSLFYLGCLMQELAFKATHFSIVGPRIVSLIGASLAATTAMGYLSSRQVPLKIAALLGLALLLDPLFVQSYRGDRIDCWVIAICFAACWLLRSSIERIHNKQSNLFPVSLAGSLSVIAVFIWPSALILYPLILVELLSLLYVTTQETNSLTSALQLILIFAGAVIITSILILIPITSQLEILVNNFFRFTSNQVGGFGLSAIINFFVSFKNSPFLPLLAVISCMYRRDKLLLIASLFALSLVLNSGVYVHRVIYMLPYFITLSSQLYRQDKKSPIQKLISHSKKYLYLLLIWAITLSLLVRPAIGLSNYDGRNPNLLVNIGTSYIGKNEYKVWDSTWNFYQTARLLGWKVYQPFFGVGTDDASKNFINNLDYVILSPESYLEEMIQKQGFQMKQSINMDQNIQDNPGILYKFTKNLRSRTGYGPYILYSKS